VTDALYAGLYLAENETTSGLSLRARTPGSSLPERLDCVPRNLADRRDAGAPDGGERFGDAVPLTAGGDDVGALVFGGATRRRPMFLSTLAASTAVAIQNAQRLERERRTVAQLSELSRMKSTFLATVSHELRTPLAAVLGLAELLARPESGMSPERRAQMTSQILEQAQLLSAMIEDLLDATRVEFGGLRVRQERIDVARVAERVHDTFHARGHPLQTRIGLDVPAAVGDEARLGQVLTNLAGNAFKHTRPGTAVELEVRADGDTVHVAVVDHGGGIDPEFLARIFQPFTQESATSARQEGLGLGLYIVHGLVEAMGGTVEASSALGEGSRFTVRLPRAPEG
jgi:signal transduction histidine kinase